MVTPGQVDPSANEVRSGFPQVIAATLATSDPTPQAPRPPSGACRGLVTRFRVGVARLSRVGACDDGPIRPASDRIGPTGR